MKNRTIYIVLFIILYIFVALVSGIHGFAFFGLANTSLLAIMLAIAFEIGQAAVLFSILTDNSQRKKVMPWVLMVILTLVQVMGNVYNSYKYLITNAEENLRFFKEPIFIWTQLPDAQANVILAYVQGAILPVVALLLTSMVAGFLNKKEEPEIEYIEEGVEEVEEPKKENILEADTPSEEALNKFEEIKKEREKIEEINSDKEVLENKKEDDNVEVSKKVEEIEPDDNPEDKANDEYIETIDEVSKPTIDETSGEVNLNMDHTPTHGNYFIPKKEEETEDSQFLNL